MKRFVTQKQPSPAKNFLLSFGDLPADPLPCFSGLFLPCQNCPPGRKKTLCGRPWWKVPSIAMLCMDIIRKAWKILSGITALPMTAARFLVDYQPQGENLMPEITVIRRGE